MIVNWSTANLQKKTIPMYLCKEKEKTNKTKQIIVYHKLNTCWSSVDQLLILLLSDIPLIKLLVITGLIFDLQISLCSYHSCVPVYIKKKQKNKQTKKLTNKSSFYYLVNNLSSVDQMLIISWSTVKSLVDQLLIFKNGLSIILVLFLFKKTEQTNKQTKQTI